MSEPAIGVATPSSDCGSESSFSIAENGSLGSTCVKNSVMLCHLPDRGRDLTFETPSLAFLHDMPAYRPAPQHESNFFQLSRELRDEIYSLVLTSHSSGHFALGTASKCVNCDDSRRLPVGTSTSLGPTSRVRHDTRSNIVDVFSRLSTNIRRSSSHTPPGQQSLHQR